MTERKCRLAVSNYRERSRQDIVMEKLDELKNFGFSSAVEKSTPCKLCGNESHLYDVIDLNKAILNPPYLHNELLGVPVHYYK